MAERAQPTPAPTAIAAQAGTSRGPRVVVVERDPVIAGLYVDALRLHVRDGEVEAITLDDPAIGAALAEADLCLCSVGADAATQFDDLVRLLLVRPDVPVVVLLPACQGSAERVARAIDLGAADVLLRTSGYLDQLPVTVRRVVMQARGAGYAGAHTRALRQSLAGIHAENRTLQGLIERLESLAATDALTGLLNKRALDRALGRVFATSRRYGHELSCLAIDADGFKRVNDTLGHAAGDRLLRLIAEVIVRECRQSDIAARPGGDEFIVLLPHTGPREAVAVAERLRTRFAEAASELVAGTECAAGPGGLGLTIGVACRGEHAPDSAEQLLAAADGALYVGKRNGRGRVVLAPLGGGAGVRRAA